MTTMQREREEIALFIEGFAECEHDEDRMHRVANKVRARTCEERGHLMPIVGTNQLYGRQQCRYCQEDLMGAAIYSYPVRKGTPAQSLNSG
jgi:hypothetical protein